MKLRMTVVLVALLGVSVAARAEENPIVIGVPMPLTGVLAQAGQNILAGIQYATDQTNKQGGLLGRPIKLLVEDTKSEPNTAATVASKLASEDHVFAFVGGYGSTADFAMLQSIRRFKTIFIHTASSSSRIEQGFGKEDWYYHVYIWDSHRELAVARFLGEMEPKPKTVAIAYEDGLYGSDTSKYAEQYLKQAGFDVVMREPFKAGSPDFSPILSRVKGLNPDAFFFVGYSGDNVQVVRQENSLGIKPKLTMLLSAGDKRSDYGDLGIGITQLAEWAPEETTPGNAEFVKNVMAATGMTSIQTSFVQGYAGMETLIDAVKAAGSTDQAAVLKQLDTLDFVLPYGRLKYQASEGGARHQLLTDANMVLLQFRGGGEQVVLPPDSAGGKLIYPAP
jgi:branched-chain amino acid transport system substrate-binding protein